MAYVYVKELSAEENTARALVAIANELEKLGLAGATTELGALELVAREIKDGLQKLTGVLEQIGEVVDLLGPN